MGFNRIRIGDIVELHKENCGIPNLTVWDISGINKDKEFFEPSKQVGADTSNYKIVPPNYFACNLMHVGRDVVLPISLNTTKKNKVVSPAYTIFKLTNNEKLLNEYFFVWLKSPEKDRFFWLFTDASVRDGLSWDDFCNIEITVPPIEIQKKYVAVYQAMLANQQAYEQGIDELKLVCDGFLENLIKSCELEKIKPYLQRIDNRNTDNALKNVMGVSVYKQFRKPTAKVNLNNLSNYKIVKPSQFSFVQTTHNEKVFAYALNLTNQDILVTSVNEVFSVDETKIYPEYLAMFFNRSEFDRYARYHSWGSAREVFSWADLCEVKIPIPELSVQKSIVDIYKVYLERKAISEKLKEQIKNICPILIKGAVADSQVS